MNVTEKKKKKMQNIVLVCSKMPKIGPLNTLKLFFAKCFMSTFSGPNFSLDNFAQESSPKNTKSVHLG